LQTFLPYADFATSAKCLDNQRLGKQRVEVYQLLRCINGETDGWRNHPCTRMWRDYKNALVGYGLAICDEWIDRGFNDTLREKISAYSVEGPYLVPYWLGRDTFHASHRSNLLRKDPVWYGKFGWTELPILPYVWPL
jgi:hypothetical protein